MLNMIITGDKLKVLGISMIDDLHGIIVNNGIQSIYRLGAF